MDIKLPTEFYSLDPTVQLALLGLVSPDEEVVWVGKPHRRLLCASGCFYFALALLMVAAMVYIVTNYQVDLTQTENWPPLFVPTMIALAALAMPFWNQTMANKTGYMLTTERALIAEPERFTPYSPQAKVFPLHRALVKQVKLHRTTGDIVFGAETTGYVRTYIGNGVYASSSNKRLIGFLDIENAREVVNLMYHYSH